MENSGQNVDFVWFFKALTFATVGQWSPSSQLGCVSIGKRLKPNPVDFEMAPKSAAVLRPIVSETKRVALDDISTEADSGWREKDQSRFLATGFRDVIQCVDCGITWVSI